jgi:hypothetical protein
MDQQIKSSPRMAPLPIGHSPELQDQFEAMHLAGRGWTAGKHAR